MPVFFTRERSSHGGGKIVHIFDESLFARHLDLEPLGHRRRGLVRCRFHDDRSASLSLDLDAGVFHCFGCGQQGGLKRFAALVGEMEASPSNPTTEDEPNPWLIAMRLARRQAWSRDGVGDVYTSSDWIRVQRQRIARIRAAANEDDWCWLKAAADAERFVESVEAELDDLLRSWHL